MRWREFIFSEERKHKVMRHLAFWTLWWLYFLLCYLLFQQPINEPNINPFYFTPGDHLPLKTFLLVLLYTLCCYPLIYLILPNLIKGKWLKGTVYFIVLCTVLYIATHILYWQLFSFLDSLRDTSKTIPSLSRSWPAINLGLMNFAKVAAAATIIKYIKYWWQKQQESQLLEKEKINADLQLLKAQIHPDFLFKTLDNIYAHALSFSPRTSGMLLKLSDLLSYMLYDCDRLLVPLEKEIAMMRQYIQLEKIRHSDEFEMEVNVKGDLTGKMIAPFLLLPFIKNSFQYSSQMTEQFWINMDIRIEGDHFSMNLANGIPEKRQDHNSFATTDLDNVRKRLTLLYPDNHEIKMTSEQEMFIVFLHIHLNGKGKYSSQEEETIPLQRENEKSANSILKYASE